MRPIAIQAALVVFAAVLQAGGDNPILHAWRVNPAAQAPNTSSELRAVLPDVHHVRTEGDHIFVESAGLSLQSMGALQLADPRSLPEKRSLVFKLPLVAQPAGRAFAPTPFGAMGVFVNGVPIYSPVSAVSWHDQNLWHLDAVAPAAGGISPAGTDSSLLTALLNADNRHSPLIGFALDGYPIYGPYGWDEQRTVRRFSSSYRLRRIAVRDRLADGTLLTPSQEGPSVNAEYPLGSFIEDYEYVAGSGDLDEHNGRLAKTPEYPNGTYAYFLSTDNKPRMEYPYLIGASYFGQIDCAPSSAIPLIEHLPLNPKEAGHIRLITPRATASGRSMELTLRIEDAQGRPISFLEKVHEKPVHLAIVSTDLSEFAHVHPELRADGTYRLNHAFPHRGTYWLFADYTRPGGAQTVARFSLGVEGGENPATSEPAKDTLRIRLTQPPVLKAGQDLNLRFDASDATTGEPVTDLEPYLGAWAHVMIVSADRETFIHAHPSDDGATSVADNPWQHTHTAPGPSPSFVNVTTGFRKPGVYKLWIQFQRQGRVLTFPFSLRVEAGEQRARNAVRPLPADAIRIQVSSAGFTPSRITAPLGKPVALAFDRADAQSCANTVVFPELGIRKALPPGHTTVIEIPASAPRELHFACGMNMYRGALLIR